MILEIATAAWVCFAGVICYDSAHVAVAGNEVATIITDEQEIAGLIVDCKARTHRVMMKGEVAEGAFERGSIAEMLCDKYLPSS